MMELLLGHDSPATAYVVDDYPYGFTLRCRIRYWIETKKGKGQRFVSQTTNPKITSREVWNKPKASTYSPILVMFLDTTGYVTHDGLGIYATDEKIDEFERIYGDALQDEYHQSAIRFLRAVNERERHRTYTATSSYVNFKKDEE